MSIAIKETPKKLSAYYTHDFLFDRNRGFGFCCDSEGKILVEKNTPEAIKNYEWCLNNLDKFKYDEIVKHWVMTGGERVGHCHCGREFDMYDQYLGTCECPNCGQWYNLMGQEVLAPYQYNPDEG